MSELMWYSFLASEKAIYPVWCEQKLIFLHTFLWFQEKVWGIAYEIASKDIPGVLEYLDFREKNGYKASWVRFHPKNAEHQAFQAKLYIATPQNEFYLGPAPLPEIAEQILTSKGPSGTNYEYLMNLAQAVRNLSAEIEDDHLFQLETLVKSGLSKTA